MGNYTIRRELYIFIACSSSARKYLLRIFTTPRRFPESIPTSIKNLHLRRNVCVNLRSNRFTTTDNKRQESRERKTERAGDYFSLKIKIFFHRLRSTFSLIFSLITVTRYYRKVKKQNLFRCFCRKNSTTLEKFHLQISRLELYPDDSEYVDQLLHEVATKPILHVGESNVI